MAYCGPQGIPLDTFLGWPQASQDAALMWQAHEGRRYPDGTHPDDWDPEQGGSRRAFHTHIDVHPGAQLIETAMNSPDFAAAGKGAHVRLVPGDAAACTRCGQQH